MEIKLLITALPVVFILHDLEEIIFFETWLSQNKDLLKTRFPRLSKRMLPHLEKLSTASFTIAVAEELLLLSLITYLSVAWETYSLWFAAFMAFSLHLAGHIVQWIILRRYVPSVVTSLLCLPYCFYAGSRFLSASGMTLGQVLGWTTVGLVLMLANLLLAHRLALVFERWRTARIGGDQ